MATRSFRRDHARHTTLHGVTYQACTGASWWAAWWSNHFVCSKLGRRSHNWRRSGGTVIGGGPLWAEVPLQPGSLTLRDAAVSDPLPAAAPFLPFVLVRSIRPHCCELIAVEAVVDPREELVDALYARGGPLCGLPARANVATSLAALVAVSVILAVLQPSLAQAGEWVQRSCSVGTEYISQEGWESRDIEGYTEAPHDDCKTLGGGLRVDIAPIGAGYMPLAGEIWAYKPPAGSTIAGGTLSVEMTAREGVASIAAKVKGSVVELGKCESPGCLHYSGDLPITAVGATEIYEQAACFGKEGVCHTPEGEPFEDEGDGEFSAEAELSSAQILLSTNAFPAAYGLGGTLLSSTVTGKATLSFTAIDAGPGIYQVRVKVNGEQVLAETPSLNEGKCSSTGTSEGARAFNYAQPCPTETPVHAEIETAGLADGTHALTVELEDAAGDATTVLEREIDVENGSPAAPASRTVPASSKVPAKPVLKQPARAQVTLRVAPRYVSAGGSIQISGRVLGGHLPRGGKQLVLQDRPAGGRWSEFEVVRTGRHGRFRVSYPSEFLGPGRWEIRVVCEAQAGYPFAAGASRVVPVRVRVG
jgi:hypothetical protein